MRNAKGETPLDLASKYGRLEVVRCLLESNPHMVLNAMVDDPRRGDAQIPPPFSPLHLASKNGKTEVVRLLLDAGFDINFFVSFAYISSYANLCTCTFVHICVS